MIHIATVHWQTDKWIDIQIRYLKRFIKEDFRIYAFLNDLPSDHSGKFYYSCTEPILKHAVKLNILGEIIKFCSKDKKDIIIFLDGDAFPVGDVLKLIMSKIGKHKLLAIQRIENNGDKQPHPSFCATTVGFWIEIKGDWKSGYKWKNNQGKLITDIGGNLLGLLKERNIEWYPLHRTGQLHEHPLWFAIYDNVVYHHASGFRKGHGRITYQIKGIEKIRNKPLTKIFDKIPDDFIIALKEKYHPLKRFKRKVNEKYWRLNEQVYKKIKTEDPFIKFYKPL